MSVFFLGRYVGDCQIPLACTMFLEVKGRELLLKNLYRNFVLHMCSLFDFGLVSPVTLYTTIQRLQDLIGESGEVKEILQNSWQAQRRHWLAGDCNGQSSQQEKTGSVEPSLRRKTMTQSMQMGGAQQHGTTKGQIMSIHGQGRKSTPSCSSLHKGQAASSSVDSSQLKRKTTQSATQQSLPLGSIQQNSLKGQMLVGSGDSAVMLQQRRKSASSVVSQTNVGGGESVLLQQRRRSLGQQNNTTQSHLETLPPLRRKSFHQLTSTPDQSANKGQILASHNSQGLMSSVMPEVAGLSHRRKSTVGQSSDVNHMHSTHSSKSSGS